MMIKEINILIPRLSYPMDSMHGNRLIYYAINSFVRTSLKDSPDQLINCMILFSYSPQGVRLYLFTHSKLIARISKQ